VTDYSNRSLGELRQTYLRESSDAMPIAGFICWAAVAALAWYLRDALPYWAILVAPAAPLPLSVLIDKLRGRPSVFEGDSSHPMTRLFMRFISVIGVMVFFVIFAAKEANSMAILALGVGLLSGAIWVPHGWSADDSAGLTQFLLRAALCFTAYFLAPDTFAVAAIAAAVAVSYIHAIVFMKKPKDAG
jgi:hypothetical protein